MTTAWQLRPIDHALILFLKIRSLSLGFSLNQHPLSDQRAREKIDDSADAGNALEVRMRQQPQRLIARGAEAIRETMAAYVGLTPHMDVVTHHTTVAGDFAMTRSQWLIKGRNAKGEPVEVHHHGMEVHRRLPNGTWAFFIDHPFGADASWAIDAPPATE